LSKDKFQLRQTEDFSYWYNGLKDIRAKSRIMARLARMARMEAGNFGVVESVGNGVSEVKIDYGPGYRLYFVVRGRQIVVLLCGGDKSTQSRDINFAKRLAKEV